MNREYLLSRATQLIETHPYPSANADALCTLLERCQPLRLMDGAELCREGEPGNALFFLMDGSIQVWRRDNRGDPRALATVEAPALVGHMALVDGSTRSASCSAVGHVRALVLDRQTYLAIMSELSPEGTALRRLLLSSLSQQLTGGNRQLRALVGGVEPEEDLEEVDFEPADPPTLEVNVELDVEPDTELIPEPRPLPAPPPAPRPPPAAPLAAPDYAAPQPPLEGESPIPSARELLSEEDLLEVSGILEGWKRRK